MLFVGRVITGLGVGIISLIVPVSTQLVKKTSVSGVLQNLVQKGFH